MKKLLLILAIFAIFSLSCASNSGNVSSKERQEFYQNGGGRYRVENEQEEGE